MRDYFFNEWYFAPIWLAHTYVFGHGAVQNFRKMRKNGLRLFPAVYYSLGSGITASLTKACVNDGLEKFLQ